MHRKPFLLLAIAGLFLFIIGVITTFMGTTDAAAGHSQTALPKYLSEASGLARVDDNLLLVHNDEKGHIYTIELPGLQVTKLVSLGNPVVKDDFEDIAVQDNSIFLITGTGKLYQVGDVSFDKPGQVSGWKVFDTGLATTCEVEGLHHDYSYNNTYDNTRLLIPCKNILSGDSKNAIRVYSYIPGNNTQAVLLFSLNDERLKGNAKNVTAIESDMTSYYLLTPVNVLRVNRHTLALEIFPLKSGAHGQPEGIALMDDGSLFLVDERKNGAGGLTRYESVTAIPAD